MSYFTIILLIKVFVKKIGAHYKLYIKGFANQTPIYVYNVSVKISTLIVNIIIYMTHELYLFIE